jgi:uncharacterized membrane protein SpoIIM required for sporulation
MNVDKFYQSRRKEWELLSHLLDSGQRDIQRLSPKDVEMLASLYREASSDLALAKRDFPNHQVTRYLNQLVARAHALLYQGEPLAFRRLWDFVAAGFPRLFRETAVFTLAAFLMFAVPALVAGIGIALDTDRAQWLLPEGAQRLIPIVEDRSLWIDIPIEKRPYASSFIMQNNIQVSFLAFGSGITGGIFTFYILVNNGLMLGGLLGLTSQYGVGWDLANFVIGHGVIELSVIFMAGGSGLMIGWAILRPGLMRRRDALALAARKAVWLLSGAAPMLVVAGIIEGFISPSETIPPPVKWAVGIGSGILLYSYLLLAGREKKARWKTPDQP